MKKYIIKIILILTCVFASQISYAYVYYFYPASDSRINFVGRALEGKHGSMSFDWSGSYFTFSFYGCNCNMDAVDTGRNYFNVFIDGKLTDTITTTTDSVTISLASNLPKAVHKVVLQKRTEAEQGRTTVYGFAVDGEILDGVTSKNRFIEFIGDSHTCGYGVEGHMGESFTPETENCNLAWGCIISRYFDADYSLIAHSGQGVVRNYGDEKDYSDYTMRERMMCVFDMDSTYKWDFRRKPDIVVIKLGTNDLSKGIVPSKEKFGKAFTLMISRLREKYGKLTPILYVVPQNCRIFYDYLTVLAPKLDDKNFRFMLHDVAVNNWGSDMGANFHPNHEGQKKLAMSVIPYISTMTGWSTNNNIIE